MKLAGDDNEGVRSGAQSATTTLHAEVGSRKSAGPAHPDVTRTGQEGSLLVRQLVHKAAAAEVLLLDVEKVAPELWRFGFEIPRGHVGNRYPASKQVPLLLGLEVVRQSGIAVAHLAESVPLDWKFLLRSISFSWGAAVPNYRPFEPFRGTLDVELTDRRVRHRAVSGLMADVRLAAHGTPIARGTGDIDFLTPQNYRAVRRFRGGPREPSVLPALVDITATSNGLTAVLGADTEDPFVFDHDSDHAPGMLLAKAAALAHETVFLGAPCSSISLRCDRFAELDRQVQVSTSRAYPDLSTTRFSQGGDVVAEAVCGSTL